MIFRQFAERALGSKVKVKLLMHLLSENIPTSERELAQMLGISHMAVNKAMKEFSDINLVSSLRIGTAQTWKLKEGSYAFDALKDLTFLARNPPFAHLKGEIKSAIGSFPAVKKAVIFGSVAEGRELPSSDIDLLIIIGKKEQKGPLLSALSSLAEKSLLLYGNRLSALVLTEKEAALPRWRHLMKNAEKGVAVIP